MNNTQVTGWIHIADAALLGVAIALDGVAQQEGSAWAGDQESGNKRGPAGLDELGEVLHGLDRLSNSVVDKRATLGMGPAGISDSNPLAIGAKLFHSHSAAGCSFDGNAVVERDGPGLAKPIRYIGSMCSDELG